MIYCYCVLTFYLKYAIRKVQQNQLLFYADDINLLSKNINTVKTQALLFTSKKNGLDVNLENRDKVFVCSSLEYSVKFIKEMYINQNPTISPCFSQNGA
jgi:hypothetical protein